MRKICARNGQPCTSGWGDRNAQYRKRRHRRDYNYDVGTALIGGSALLQTGVLCGRLLVAVRHVRNRLGRFVNQQLARLRCVQRLREQEHQNDAPAQQQCGTTVGEGHNGLVGLTVNEY